MELREAQVGDIIETTTGQWLGRMLGGTVPAKTFLWEVDAVGVAFVTGHDVNGDKVFMYKCKEPLITHRLHPASPRAAAKDFADTVRSAEKHLPRVDAVCTRCNLTNEYAEPSASYVCYNCRC
jgi:hypothetical protein